MFHSAGNNFKLKAKWLRQNVNLIYEHLGGETFPPRFLFAACICWLEVLFLSAHTPPLLFTIGINSNDGSEAGWRNFLKLSAYLVTFLNSIMRVFERGKIYFFNEVDGAVDASGEEIYSREKFSKDNARMKWCGGDMK